jgi:hypothetical protein
VSGGLIVVGQGEGQVVLGHSVQLAMLMSMLCVDQSWRGKLKIPCAAFVRTDAINQIT